MAAGFQDVTSQVNFRSGSGIIRGDVLITGQKGHTAMSIGDGQVVQASINEFGGTVGGQTGDQTGQEIWVTRYYNYPWGYCLRYPGGRKCDTSEPRCSVVRWIPAVKEEERWNQQSFKFGFKSQRDYKCDLCDTA